MILKACKHCTSLFETTRKDALYCSTKCRKAASRANNISESPIKDDHKWLIDLYNECVMKYGADKMKAKLQMTLERINEGIIKLL